MATPWAALGQDVEVLYVMGCPDMHCANDTFIFQVVEAAKNTDPTIVFIRLDISIKIEGLDQTNLVSGYQTNAWSTDEPS